MGIFTRLRDIISSNINSMLDKAEDPEKLIRLMIQEMEDTQVEIKAACAGAMAQAKKIQRQAQAVRDRATGWEEKAHLAADKARADLAREALVQKRLFLARAESLEAELVETQELVDRYHQDIAQLEDKLAAVREKQRILIQRHLHARHQMRSQQDIRRADASDVMIRFEQFENRVERMEAEAELVNAHRGGGLERELDRLREDSELERELDQLMKRSAPAPAPAKAKAGKAQS